MPAFPSPPAVSAPGLSASSARTARPQAIILTHGHFDHTGAVEELLKNWDVPVYAHPREMPYLTGQIKYPPPDPGVGGGLMSFISPLYPRGPVDISDHRAPASG